MLEIKKIPSYQEDLFYYELVSFTKDSYIKEEGKINTHDKYLNKMYYFTLNDKSKETLKYLGINIETFIQLTYSHSYTFRGLKTEEQKNNKDITEKREFSLRDKYRDIDKDFQQRFNDIFEIIEQQIKMHNNYVNYTITRGIKEGDYKEHIESLFSKSGQEMKDIQELKELREKIESLRDKENKLHNSIHNSKMDILLIDIDNDKTIVCTATDELKETIKNMYRDDNKKLKYKRTRR